MSIPSLEQTKKAIAILILVGIILGLLALSAGSVLGRDSILFWTTGRLLLLHQNPYDAAAFLRLQRSVGVKDPGLLLMQLYAAPNSLFLVLPLGFFSPAVAGILWTLLTFTCIIASVHLLWTIYGNPLEPVPLVAYFFAPSMACVAMGQSGAFLVFGLVCFLKWHSVRPFLAGASLVLVACKPHLLLPFLLVLLLWTIATHGYRLLFGAVVGFLAVMALALWFDHSVVTDYLPTARLAQNSVVPNVSCFLRAVTSPTTAGLQYLPAAAAGVWAIWYFIKHRCTWDWAHNGLVLLVISVWAAPYSWVSDEILVLPAIVAANYWMAERRRSAFPFFCLNSVALLLLGFSIQPNSWAYLWTTTAWLGWYLYAIHQVSVISDLALKQDSLISV